MSKVMTKRSATMSDVARLAGVSQATVSYVLNGRSEIHISDETKQKIWQAVEELSYRPNAMARSLRSNRSKFIGFISDEIASTPYAGKMVLGAQEAAWQSGKLLLLINTGSDPEMEEAAVQTLLEHQVDGIIYAKVFHHVARPPTSLCQTPCVLLDCYAEDGSLPSVVPDEVQGGRAATEVLLNKGHRRIGFIDIDDPIPATFGRLEGYQQALTAHHVPFDPALVRTVPTFARGGYQGALELMQLPDPPTAIFCFSDYVAMGAYDALRTLGLSIPNDVAVIGFDNQEIVAANLYPALSTMALPHYQLGEWAVKFLLEQAGQTPPPVQHKIACPYVERQSL